MSLTEKESIGIRERSVLIALMALNREVMNSELDKRYKLGLDRSQRERLNRIGLVRSEKRRTSGFAHELTEKGWGWVTRELSAEVPANAGSAGGGLYALLHGLRELLDRRSLALAELFGDARLGRNPTGPSPAPAHPEVALHDKIRAAYSRLAPRPRDWVYLRNLRPLLNGASRAEIDTALLEMYDAREIVLTIQDDQKSLTPADHAAAIRVGVRDMHLISME